jgi:tRNA G10  N-methylase Trm11
MSLKVNCTGKRLFFGRSKYVVSIEKTSHWRHGVKKPDLNIVGLKYLLSRVAAQTTSAAFNKIAVISLGV